MLTGVDSRVKLRPFLLKLSPERRVGWEAEVELADTEGPVKLGSLL